jgi:hypothetical protein
MDQVSVKYIGKRAQYTDGTYGTRILFIQGESRLVPIDKARLMLKHPDVYVPGEADAVAAVIPEEQAKKPDDETQDMRDAIAIMDKVALEAYAKTNFRVNIDRRKNVEALRAEVTGLVDRFGAL